MYGVTNCYFFPSLSSSEQKILHHNIFENLTILKNRATNQPIHIIIGLALFGVLF